MPVQNLQDLPVLETVAVVGSHDDVEQFLADVGANADQFLDGLVRHPVYQDHTIRYIGHHHGEVTTSKFNRIIEVSNDHHVSLD